MYISDGNYHLFSNLPAYGSRIIEKESGGIGGEIFFNEDDKEFFNITGKIIHEQGKNSNSSKQLYELHPLNEYLFDFENLFSYLLDIKNEFINHTLNTYKTFTRDADKDKRITLDGWESRKQAIIDLKDNLSFKMYLKKSTNNRCFIGSSDSSNIYSKIITYTVIPNYTNLTIQRIDKEDGGAKYIFRLFFNNNMEDLVETKKTTKQETALRKEKTVEELITAAIKQEQKKTTSQHTASNPYGNQHPKKRISNEYERNTTISAAVKQRAEGKCDLCGNDAPFVDDLGQPFLEEHHVEWLMNGGSDSLNNAVALCPNCHRKMHICNDASDVEKLYQRIKYYSEKYAKIINDAKQ